MAKRYGTADILKIVTWNVKGLNTKGMEFQDI